MKSTIFLCGLLLMSNLCLPQSQWVVQQSNTSYGITDVSFADDSVGYATAFLKRIYKTTDGGNHWQEINTGINMTLVAVEATNRNTLFTSRFPLYKSEDGGASFTDLLFLDGIGASISDIEFVNEQTGFLVNVNDVYKTTDAGVTWTMTGAAVVSHPRLQVDCYPVCYAASGATVFDGWGGGGIIRSEGQIYKTTDSGKTWQSLNIVTSEILGFYFINERIGYFSNLFGELHKTTDGGQSFVLVSADILDSVITDMIFIE